MCWIDRIVINLFLSQSTSATAEDQELDIEGDDSGDSDAEKPGDTEDGVGIQRDLEGESGEREGIQENDSEGDNDDHLGVTVDNEDGGTDLKDNSEDKGDSDSDEDDLSYPDTSIDLQYKSGGKYQLQRGTSTTTSQATEDFVDLGDGEIFDLRSLGKDDGPRKQRLSAKQRRQMKKKVEVNDKNDAESQEDVPSGPKPEVNKPRGDAGQSKQPITQQNVSKRGKKSKLKKIKEKYGDQDEEDRELMMQFLGSAGAPKESKRKKGKDTKGRKGSAQNSQGERRVTKDNKGGTVKTAPNTDKLEDGQSGGGSEAASGGQALENFAGDLVQGLTTDHVNKQQETEVKVLQSHSIYFFIPSFVSSHVYYFSFFTVGRDG